MFVCYRWRLGTRTVHHSTAKSATTKSSLQALHLQSTAMVSACVCAWCERVWLDEWRDGTVVPADDVMRSDVCVRERRRCQAAQTFQSPPAWRLHLIQIDSALSAKAASQSWAAGPWVLASAALFFTVSGEPNWAATQGFPFISGLVNKPQIERSLQ